MPTAYDDLGHEVPLPGRVERVVSLVPSITESLVSVDRAAVVGATDWCTCPPDLDVERVRSWDHRKLGMDPIPLGGTTAEFL